MENTPTAVPQEEKSELTILIENAKKCRSYFPASISITRNNVAMPAAPRKYSKGDKKEAGIEFIGPTNEYFVVDKLEEIITWLTPEKALTALKNIVINTFQASTENACDGGVWQQDLFVKGVEEFSAKGESSTELREEKAELDQEITRMSDDTTFMARCIPGSKEFKELTETMRQLAYCNKILEQRKRGPRNK